MATNNGLNNKSEPLTSTTVTATGLTFDGSNTISNYVESGTWTPVLSFGNHSTGITYSAQQGYYNRIGDVVLYNIRVVITNAGSETGYLRITLPITPAALSIEQVQSGSAMLYQFTTPTSGTWYVAKVYYSEGAYVSLWRTVMDGSSSGYRASELDVSNGSHIRISGFYWV